MNHKKLNLRLCSVAALLIVLSTTWAEIGYSEKSEFNRAVDFVRDKDYQSAVPIFAALAKKNDHQAQYNLALLLRKGLGHPSNYPLALQWAWLSQLSGLAKSAELSKELLSFVPKETQEIVRSNVLKILQKRMDENDQGVILQKAQFHLTVVLEPDYVAAYALRSLGAAIGLRGAIELRDEIEGNLEPKDLMESQARATQLFMDFDWNKLKK